MPDISDRLTDAVKDSFSKNGSLMVDVLRQSVLDAGKLATGNLYNSITYNVDNYDTLVILEVNGADYFKNVDLGRGAGKKFPPIDKILEWVQIRGITPRAGLTGKKKISLDKGQRDLAYVIARSIANKGIAASNLRNGLQPILDSLSGDMNAAINKATQEITAELAMNSFSNRKINFTTNFK